MKKFGGASAVVKVWQNLPPMVGIKLTDLSKIGGQGRADYAHQLLLASPITAKSQKFAVMYK